MPLIAENNTENHKRSFSLSALKTGCAFTGFGDVKNFISQQSLLIYLLMFYFLAFVFCLTLLSIHQRVSPDGKGSPNTATFYWLSLTVLRILRPVLYILFTSPSMECKYPPSIS
jgi:hypothetical protein